MLRWLLGEPEAERAAAHLRGAARVVASHLTIVECERALVRLAPTLPTAQRNQARMLLADLASKWTLVEIDAQVRDRAGQPFPVEPIRTLDALHLATALELIPTLGSIEILTCDARLIANAEALGIPCAS